MEYVTKFDHGEFISITGGLRVRASLIQGYAAIRPQKGKEAEFIPGVNIFFSNGQIVSVPLESLEAADREVERLDWIFRRITGAKPEASKEK